MDEELDVKTLKYVLYARKSTTDESRQIRSIPDQIEDCLRLKARLGLNVVDIVTEEKSAKKPQLRPEFNQLLKDLRKGKYDGILAWNPDRLARNMLEGGQLIDMIDQDIIKDLKFVTHYFTKDANGKMLLGMAFVLSKQYSDDLSQKVKRGVRGNLEEGKSSTFKHGYIRDKDGFYRPDGKNFELMRQAWDMKKNGIALEVIATDINKAGYARVLKSRDSKVLLSKQTLSKIFMDPFYYGILVQANQEVDLRNLPGYNFEPMISEEIYLDVQKLAGTKINPYRPKKERATYYPLKQLVTCSICGSHMYAGASRGGSGTRYLSYRCDNKFCTRKKRSIRDRVVFDFIYAFLKDGLNFTEQDYKSYLESMTSLSTSKMEELRIDVHSKEGRIKILNAEITDISYKIINFKDNKIVYTANSERLEDLQDEMDMLKADVAKSKELLKTPEKDIVSFEQFLNLSKNAGTAVENGDAVIKDAICRLIFLNFSIDEEKVVSYQLKPPFDVLLKTRVVNNGRGRRT